MSNLSSAFGRYISDLRLRAPLDMGAVLLFFSLPVNIYNQLWISIIRISDIHNSNE